jgi:hypothetical protein
MAQVDEREALLRAYFEVLGGGAIERLWQLLAEDYSDKNPIPGQLPGRGGVIMKAILFRRDHLDAHITIEAIELTEAGARATWTTTANGLNGAQGIAAWRFSAVFEIDDKIRSSDVTVMEKVETEYSD